jgi:aspartate racemase
MARLGIIAGSGPEAGIDLWTKILAHSRALAGTDFRGDLDAPEVSIVSDPLLGLSMELERNHHLVWPVLARAATRLAPLVDCYAIACNTLNVYADDLNALGLPARLVSFVDVLVDDLRQRRVGRVALLGARPVTELGPWSTYERVVDAVELERLTPRQVQDLQTLIYDIKTFGGQGAGLSERFEALLAELRSEVVVLACTELPLLRVDGKAKRLVDPTDLVARSLARRARGADRPLAAALVAARS